MNLICALSNLSQCENFKLREVNSSVPNIVSYKGQPLEVFIRSIFCGIPGNANSFVDENNVFSYLGGKKNPPDAMLRNQGDAIEIKKVEKPKGSVVLNSSLPKTVLHSNDKMITKKAKQCESWESRDLLYVVGYETHRELKSLFFFYGDCFARSNTFYQNIFSNVKHSIAQVSGVTSNSNEYGFLSNVDGLGNGVRMRIRPINSFDSPWKIFKQHVQYNPNAKFMFASIMRESKYLTFSQEDRLILENLSEVSNIRIRDPENPSLTIKSVLIKKMII